MNSTALVIDDDASARKIVAYFFAEQNLGVLEAKNGEEGIPLLLNDRPQIIVLDWRMPVLSGSEMLALSDQVLTIIRKIEGKRNNIKLNLVLYTSLKFEELKIPKMKNFNMLGYIHKGWSLELQKRKFDSIVESWMFNRGDL